MPRTSARNAKSRQSEAEKAFILRPRSLPIKGRRKRQLADDLTFPLGFRDEIIVDNFAGGGGASTGIRMGIGREVDIAVNHDPEAIAMHEHNHPKTAHYCESVFDVDPIKATGNQPVGFAWFSPDCKHHSRAKGKKPKDKNIRGLAWIVLRWAVLTKFRVGGLENVAEFQDWCPLDEHNHPIKDRKGETFKAFVAALTTGLHPDHPAFEEIRATLGPDFPYQHLYNGLGYKVEWREIRACDYGAPTIRKRLFMIMRRDGLPICWPAPTHGDPKSEAVQSGRLKPWRIAGECIDWSIPTRSIFDRKKPLAENTLKRIAKGMKKFVLESSSPFIVGVGGPSYGGKPRSVNEPMNTLLAENHANVATPYLAKFRFDSAGASLGDPLPTITAGGESVRPAGAAHAMGLVSPILLHQGHTGDVSSSRCQSAEAPFNTITASREKSLLTAHLVGIDNAGSGASSAWGADEPLRTTTTENRHAVVVAHMLQQNGGFYDGDGRSMAEPMSTITAAGSQQQLVTSNLIKMYGTCEHGQSMQDPLATVTATGQHLAEVRSFMAKQHSTSATLPPAINARHEAVRAFAKQYLGIEAMTTVINGMLYEVVDICLRMLVPKELYKAQGFPDDYVIEFDHNGKPLSKSAQVRMCGNSVSPVVAEALTRANFTHEKSFARVA